MKSVWSDEAHIDKQNRFMQRDITADVVVAGAGIAGMNIACLLKKEGARVIVVEKDRVGGGMTKNTTAKITAGHTLIYKKLAEHADEDKAKQYARANTLAIEQYFDIVNELKIDCVLERKPNYVYSMRDHKCIEDEVKLTQRLGLDTAYTTRTTLPFDIKAAIRYENQAQFNPLLYLAALAREIDIFEDTTVLGIEDGTVKTDRGIIRAKQLVVATHFPFINTPGFYFMRMHQARSYALAVKTGDILDGMYIDENPDGLSFRGYKDMTIIGGGGHRTGENSSGGQYEKLRKEAARLYPGASELYSWSAQDCMSMDDIPYIGRYSISSENIYVATGFNKWGMTSSMVSAMLLCDLMNGRINENAEVFSPDRFAIKNVKSFMNDTAHAVSGLSKRFFDMPKEHISHINPGHGGLVEYDGEKLGVYVDESGEVHMVSAKCPHLGCQLDFNPDEKTWECPCHGSRFDIKGNIINNPATKGINLDM